MYLTMVQKNGQKNMVYYDNPEPSLVRSYKEGATTRWFVELATCNTPLASHTQTVKAVGDDIVCGVAKATQT